MSALLLVHVLPIYPVVAKDAHLQGAVVLHVTVGKDGAVKSADIISGPNPFRTAAADVVRHWVYRPFMFLGDATEVETNVTITFTLGNVNP
jgi:protein TonB